jgi:hypothetical protein
MRLGYCRHLAEDDGPAWFVRNLVEDRVTDDDP